MWFGSRTLELEIPALPWARCVTPGKLLQALCASILRQRGQNTRDVMLVLCHVHLQ